MSEPLTISIQLARFNELRTAGEVAAEHSKGLLFCSIGADSRAAATAPPSRQAFKFLVIGIHEDETSAHDFINSRPTLAPWLNESMELWEAVVQPYHHKGAANYLNPENPGLLFTTLTDSPGPKVPIVVLTSVGWITEGLNMNRVAEFGNGVAAVRISMTAIDGLHSQQSFFFPGVLEYDPMTLTIWRDAQSLGKFAYGQGTHRMQMEKHHEQNMADRTSFTRCRILWSNGTWHGTDPCAMRTAEIKEKTI